ncbi:MAG: FtsX-like permease family protein, partial [Bacteroidales bacterium]|nr:FtsX-like permease family protein [Bacteroidales bacterium]
ENSHFHFDLMGSMSTLNSSRNTFWVSHNLYTYILLEEGTNQTAFEEKMQLMVEKYVGPQIEQFLGIKMEEFAKAGNSFSYFIQPLLDIHLKSDVQYEIETNGNIQYIYIFISIAIFILVIASINFTNLSTARASKRSKEVGIRKVVGAMKAQLIFQFLMESFIITVVSLGLAVILLELFLPGLNNLVQIPLELNYFGSWYAVPSLFLLVLLVSLMAGSYPAFFLASFRPVAVLKGKLKLGVRGGMLRSILVITQFVVSVFILLSTYTVSDQLKYMLNKDLGFDKENVLMIRRSDALDNQLDAFKAELMKLPSIVEVSNANSYPGENYSNNAMFLEGESTGNTYLLHQSWISYDFEKVLNFELIEGRFFSREFASDSNAIVINEAAVKSLGLEDPIGKIILTPRSETEFIQRPIIGVVKDFNFKSLHTKIEPVAFTFMPGNWEGVVSVKLAPGNISSSIQQIQNVWDEFVNDYPFEYFFFDDHLKEMYTAEKRTNSIFVLFTILSILISFLGLLGLISFITEQRKKEIGVRKTFGSSTGNIVVIISKGILKLIIIASIVSWPIAYWVMNNWLQDFSYRVDINLVMFVVIPVLTIMLSLLTVIYQTVKAARKNPAETLRYE